MKHIFRLSIVLAVLLVAGCRNTELDDLLTDPNNPSPDNAEMQFVFANAQLEFEDFFSGRPAASTVEGINTEIMPYARMLAMTGGERYDNQDSPPNFDIEWASAYANFLPDIRLVQERAAEGGLNTMLGVAQIMEAYVAMVLVDVFGDVPYSQALQGIDEPNPEADSGADVYAAALSLLDQGIANLAEEGSQTVGTDLFYGFNEARWTALANTLKLRAHLNMRLVNTAASTSAITELANADLINTAAEAFAFQYSSNRVNPDSRHPEYEDNYETGGDDYLSNYYMFIMLGDEWAENDKPVDPRIRYYFYRQDIDATNEDFFTLDCQSLEAPEHWAQLTNNAPLPFCTAAPALGYWGRDHGNDDGIPPDDVKRTTWGVYPAAGAFDDDSAQGLADDSGAAGGRGAGIAPIMMHFFTDFMLAEAALTLGTPGDARALLESGVRTSISYVMSFSEALVTVPEAFKPTAADVDAYVNAVLAKYDAAATTDDKLNVIITEYYIALWGNGLEAYNALRRTGMPRGIQPARDPSPGAFARSMWYPSDYVNLNARASQKSVADRVFWDTNPADFIY